MIPMDRDLRHNTAYFDMPVNTYSAGMRARLAFGACLAIDFDVYLIDEVTEPGRIEHKGLPQRS